MLAFLALVQQRRGPKWDLIMFNSLSTHITTPTGSILKAHNGYIRIFWIRSGRPFNCTRGYIQITTECLFCCCCHNCNHSTFFFNASSIALAILQLKNPSKLKYMDRIHYFRKTWVLVICLLELSNRFKRKFLRRKPPRRAQPLYKGQMAQPQCVLCSEVSRKWKSSEKWGRPGNTYNVNDVRWTQSGCRGGIQRTY